MKIKECAVRRYGPLPDTGRVFFGQFSLIFGPNESGKTLLVDALIKMLLQRRREQALFERIERVDEVPDGYLILERDGEEYKLPEDGNLTSLAGISAEDCRNVFVVRSSDLTIPDEGAFYTSVTDRLTGLHSTAIERIRKTLQEIGRLTNPTSRSDLSDRQDWGKLKSRVARAKDLLSRIDELRGRIEEEGYDTLEARLLSLEQRFEEIEQNLELMEEGRKRLMYESGQRALSGLSEALLTLGELETFTEQNEQAWREKEKEIARLEEEIEQKSAEIETKKRRQEALDMQLAEVTADLETTRKRRERIDEIEAEAKIHLRDRLAWEAHQHWFQFARISGVASFLLLAVSLVGLLMTGSSLFQCFALPAAAATVLFFLWMVVLVAKRASVAKGFETVRIEAAKYGVGDSEIEGILAEIRKFREELEPKERLSADKSRELELLEREIDERRKAIRNSKERIGVLRKELEEIADRSGVQTLDEFSARVKQRREAENQRDTQAAVLRDRFGVVDDDLLANVEDWQDRLRELEEFKGRATDVQYDEEEVAQLKSQRSELVTDVEVRRQELSNYKRDLATIGSEANVVLQIGEVLPADTSLDLDGIERSLKRFIDDIVERKDLATRAIAIFEDIASQETEKVSVLFGRESEVSEYFREITAGVYEEIEFDQATASISARTGDGAKLKATQLSGGAYDQLYLSIRVALASAILGGEKGFFILDDPFLTSDAERLARQFQILRDLSEAGWQIIYFSVKDETRRVLNEDIEARRVDLHELQSIHL